LFEDAIRKALIKACSDRKTRFVPRGWPHRWYPREVIDPDTAEPFTEIAAWDFVVSRLEQDFPLKVLAMEKPAGSWAGVMLVPGEGKRRIYIKVQVFKGAAMGRSFHYSDFE